MSKAKQVEAVTLTYDLHELPTAQHRAGLAGLIFQVDAMGPNGYWKHPRLVPAIDSLTGTSATITFTRDSMQGVFDELYAAKLVEVVVQVKWPGKVQPKPGEYFIPKADPRTKEVKQVRGFAYDVVQPQAPALERHLKGDGQAWLDLWRQMVWSIPRGGNNVRARAPFIDRAHGRTCGEGAAYWDRIVDFHARRAKSSFRTEPISGALMLGAQAVNAEGIPFSGRVDHNLLLHFWQLVVLTFVPQVVNKRDAKVERVGYVLAIPDVADLVDFRDEFPAILQNFRTEGSQRTPSQARLDLPDQAALEVLRRVRDGARQAATDPTPPPGDADRGEPADPAATPSRKPASRRRGVRVDRNAVYQGLATDKAARQWGSCIRAVETFHMVKNGNNVKLLSFSRVTDSPGLVEDYERIVSTFRSPLFRAARMRALLHRRPWHWGMTELFTEYPYAFFLEIEGETPRFLPRFGRDAGRQLAAHSRELQNMTIDEMDDDERLKHLGVLVRRMVGDYVDRKAAKKLNLDWDHLPTTLVDGKKRKVIPDPEKYREQQQRVCNDAFLQMRSRHDEDFVAFFADSVCSVPHFFKGKAGDLPFLMQVLMTPAPRDPVARPALNRDDVKTLAMLALSAYSFNVRRRTESNEGSPA